MLKFKGAYETSLGNPCCEKCGTPIKKWEKMSTEYIGSSTVYIFRCSKCKNRIEAVNERRT